jgi:hypothetical protein
LAGQFAFDRADDPTAADLVQAARQIRREGRRMHVNGHGATVGFSVAEDQPQTPLLAPCAGV